jgi:hypothetical protein
MMRVVLLNEATSASPLFSQVTSTWLAAVAEACTVQLNRDVAFYHGGSANIRAGSNAGDITAGEYVFTWQDQLLDAPGAEAYHDRDGNGVPVLYGAMSTCATLDELSIAISHELCETFGDPGANLWADDGCGNEWAYELCDGVQGFSYKVGQIAVSDFLLPAFFVTGAKGPYHYLAAQGQADLASPFATAPGGYQIQRASSASSSQVNGSIPAARIARSKHWSSRVYKRGVRL